MAEGNGGGAEIVSGAVKPEGGDPKKYAPARQPLLLLSKCAMSSLRKPGSRSRKPLASQRRRLPVRPTPTTR